MDRTLASGAKSCRFESCRSHQWHRSHHLARQAERWFPVPKVVGSNPIRRTIIRQAQKNQVNCLCYNLFNMSEAPKTPNKKHHKKLFYGIGIAVIIIVVLQLVIDVGVYQSLVQVHPDDGTVLATLVTNAAEQLNKPAPVDPPTGKIYIPEAHLVMPAYTGDGHVEYLYESANPGVNIPAEIHLTSSMIMNLAKGKVWVDTANENNRFVWQSYDISKATSSIPSLQACARGVQLFFTLQNSPDRPLQFQGGHTLKDGRTLYVYSETGCQQNQTPVIAMAKQAQSYK